MNRNTKTSTSNHPHQELTARVTLPVDFRLQDFLTFHRRDKTELCERVSDNSVEKAMLINGVPCCLILTLSQNSAEISLAVDGDTAPLTPQALETLLRHMLGLTQDISAFEEAYKNDANISRLLKHSHGLRIPQTGTPFEAITWAITGQLISVEAAVSIRRRLIEKTGVPHSCGLLCQPDAGLLAATGISIYRECGYSNSKATTIQRVAQQLVDGELSLSLDDDPAAIAKNLLAVKGVGPWTVSYTLLRGFGYLDGSLHGDVAVRRNLQRLLALEEKPSEKETQQWLAPFSPYRALVAAHLWAMQSDQGY
ncbi:DNA-3-methyladenine glycosylase family protein [Enterovibrio paralichthyis]|uniref:DNA-3-methyladenine glycosylase family protein n=1 Tax=Enterovibrio paralichthyis TaxID=2853805 RepID=UPI001C44AA1D|nr:AlkA N-terminal domain-containing protein [Enterovibrio paralichthyis]MBV7299389.1 3-methyladenine DNA glycosylase 2 [Enterovibrio paralichthyis]